MLPMLARGPFQYRDRFCRTVIHKQRAHKVEVVAVRGEWIKPHSRFDPRDCSPRIAEKGQVDASLYDEPRIVGIEGQCAFQMEVALGVFGLDQGNATHDAMALSIVFIKARGVLNELYSFLKELSGAWTKFVAPGLAKRTSLPSEGRRKARVEIHRTIEMRFCFAVGLQCF